MNEKLRKFSKIFYPSWNQKWFHELIASHPAKKVLEIGAGSGWEGFEVSGVHVGIDLDERVLENKHLDVAYKMDAANIDEIEGKFDLIFSHMVGEHIEHPVDFLQQQLKKLNPGGSIYHLTVSKYYYTSLINDFIPVRLKYWLIKNLGSGRKEDDVFEAFYRLNSKGGLKKLSEYLGVEVEASYLDAPPGYLQKSYILMFIYTVIHRVASAIFPQLKPLLFIRIENPPITQEQ